MITTTRHRFLVIGLWFCLPGLQGCFLVGLSDEIAQASCDVDSDCSALSALDDDPCMAWQCRADADRGGSRYCQYTPLDADGDGFSPATVLSADDEEVVCVEDADKQDCLDSEATAFPGNDESCDTLDNDCDGLTDEGQLQLSTSSVVEFSRSVQLTDFAANPETRTIAAVYGLPAEAGASLSVKPGASMAAADTNQAQSANELLVDTGGGMRKGAVADELGVATLDDDNFAVAFYDRSGGGRMLAAILPRDQSGKWAVNVDADVEAWGLGCAADEDCADNALQTGARVPQPPSARPAVAVSGRSVLVAYERNPALLDPNCGASFSADERPTLLVNMLTRMPTGERRLVEPVPVAIPLGVSSEIERPTVAPVPPLSDALSGFLVGFAKQGGGIVVHHVWRGDDGPQTSDTPLLTIEGPGLSRPALAIGAMADGHAQLALAYQRGCVFDAQVEWQLFSLALDGAGSGLTAQRLGESVVLDADRCEGPAVAFSEEADIWGVTYRSQAGLQARMLQSDGRVRGDAPYLLIEQVTGDLPVAVQQIPRIFRLTDDPVGFASLAQVKTGDDYSVEMTRILSCEAP